MVLGKDAGNCIFAGVFKTRNGEMAIYISVFQKGKRNVCLKCPKFTKTEFQNQIEACTQKKGKKRGKKGGKKEKKRKLGSFLFAERKLPIISNLRCRSVRSDFETQSLDI